MNTSIKTGFYIIFGIIYFLYFYLNQDVIIPISNYHVSISGLIIISIIFLITFNKIRKKEKFDLFYYILIVFMIIEIIKFFSKLN